MYIGKEDTVKAKIKEQENFNPIISDTFKKSKPILVNNNSTTGNMYFDVVAEQIEWVIDTVSTFFEDTNNGERLPSASQDVTFMALVWELGSALGLLVASFAVGFVYFV